MNLHEAQALRYGAQKVEVKVYPDWIKCSDAMPDKVGSYLCVIDNGRGGAITTLFLWKDYSGEETIYQWEYGGTLVTHWMPLPAKP